MRVRFTCRHTRLTPALRALTEEKLVRLSRYLDGESEVHVILTAEKHRHGAEMIVSGPRRHFTSSAITDDLQTAIQLVLEKLAKQVRRDKRRRDDRRRRGDRSQGGTAGVAGPGRRRPPALRRQAPRAMTVAEATRSLEQDTSQFVVFRNSESDRICVLFRQADGRLGLVEDDRPIPPYS